MEEHLNSLSQKMDQVTEKLDRILAFLSQIDPENAPPTFPWTSAILLEHATGMDQDGNNLVYGIDFAFSQTHASLPPTLRAVAEYIDPKFSGRRMALSDYAQTITNEGHKQDITSFVENMK